MPVRAQRFPLRFGGKIGPASGTPVDAMVTVARLARDCWQSFGPTQVPLGDCAAVRIGGVEVVLITKRTQALGTRAVHQSGHRPARSGASSSSSRPTTSWRRSGPSPRR